MVHWQLKFVSGTKVTREGRTDKGMVVPVTKATADQTSLLSVEEHLVVGDSKVR
jgi:hypothetical protein